MTAAAPDPLADDEALDLDRERAVRQEAGARAVPLRFGGEVIAMLPAELPLLVLEPVKRLDLDIALLLRQAMTMASGNDAAASRAATDLVIDLLVARPTLPVELIDAGAEMGRRLLGEEGYGKFIAQQPSRQDVAALARGLFKRYGISLGEASAPSTSPAAGAGTTLTPTSSGSTASTPEESGPVQATLAS